MKVKLFFSLPFVALVAIESQAAASTILLQCGPLGDFRGPALIDVDTDAKHIKFEDTKYNRTEVYTDGLVETDPKWGPYKNYVVIEDDFIRFGSTPQREDLKKRGESGWAYVIDRRTGVLTDALGGSATCSLRPTRKF